MSHQHGDSPASATRADSVAAIVFSARLLSDAEVAARVHTDPERHRLWSDPAVQSRLELLRGGPEHADHLDDAAGQILRLAAMLLQDPAVLAEVERESELREGWENAAVRRVLEGR